MTEILRATHEDDYCIQDNTEDQLDYLARLDLYTMYFDKAKKEPNLKEFLITAAKEFNSNCEPEHWKLLPRSDVPKGQPILNYVWAMNRNRDIATRQVYKWKERLNVHGGKQEYGVN